MAFNFNFNNNPKLFLFSFITIKLICLNSASTTNEDVSINALNAYGQSKLFKACLSDKYSLISDILYEPDSGLNVNLVETTSKNSPLHILVERAQFAPAIEKAQVRAQQELDNKIEKIEKIEADESNDETREIDGKSESKKKTKSKKKQTDNKKKPRSADDLRSSRRDVIKIIDLIAKLITLNADLEAKSDSGWTALNKAIYLASDLPEYPLEILPLLLDGCHALNVPARQNTPLHFAAGSRVENGQRALALVNMLIKNCGDKLNYQATNSNGWTPYKVALSAGNLEVAKILAAKTSLDSSGWIGLVLTILSSGLFGLVAFLVYKYKFSQTEPLAQTEDLKIAQVGDELSIQSSDTDNTEENEKKA